MKRSLWVVALLAGCTGTIGSSDEDTVDGGTSATFEPDAASAMYGLVSVARAEEWVAAQLHYCQAPNGAHDYDAACSSTCHRTSNNGWDPYRSDCWARVVGVGPPGAGAGDEPVRAVRDRGLRTTIEAKDLQPGDAVNNSDHIMLFKAWKTPAGTKRSSSRSPAAACRHRTRTSSPRR